MTLEFGSDEQYLESWLQFNAAYRANVAAACRRVAAAATSEVAAAAPALECFQQYLFAIEDLATWAAAIPVWQSGKSVVEAIEVARAEWDVIADLKDASPDLLVTCFHLPSPGDFVGLGKREYVKRLTAWTALAGNVGHFAAEEAPNGGYLLNRLQNKTKHGLHFAAATSEQGVRVYFYPHHSIKGEPRQLPSLLVTADEAEIWLRRTYDLCRFTSAILTTLFVAAYGRDPGVAWNACTDPNRDLSLQEIEADLGAIQLPTLKCVGGPPSGEPT